MRFIVLLFILGLTNSIKAQFNIPIQPGNIRIIKSEHSFTIKEGKSKVKFIVINKDNNSPLAQTKIFLDSNKYIGKTNKKGYLSVVVNATYYNIEAIAPLVNKLTGQLVFNSQYTYEIELQMSNTKEVPISPPNQIQPCKPVIYLYPTKKQNINVKVIPKDEFLFTYPKYPENGWDVVAKPNGKIEYKNRTYNYLFWEGVSSAEYKIDMTKGFEVDSDTLIQFFEHTLTKLGLTTEEQTDFITYWGPKLEENQLNFIHFEFTEGCEKNIAKLEVTPKPDTFIRIFMTYHYIDDPIAIGLDYKDTQIIPTYKRKGFTVVEWGGSYY